MARVDGEFIIGTPVDLSATDRQRIEADIQSHLDDAVALIEELDRLDGDADFCASEHDGIEPDSDEEPSLSWTGDVNQNRALATCHGFQAREDLEAEHDGREPDEADDEPSLGWTLDGCLASDDDREEECEDEAAQCEDEGADADVLECEPSALYQ